MSYLDRLRQREFSECATPPTDKTDETHVSGAFVSFGSTQPGPFQKIEVSPLSAIDKTLVTAALDRLGEDDPQTRAEVLARCATDPDALAFWTARAPEPHPWTALYQKWLAGIDQPRALVTLDQQQIREAVACGAVSRDLAQTSVLLLVRSPAGDLGPGAVGVLAIPREKYREFSPKLAIEALGSIN